MCGPILLSALVLFVVELSIIIRVGAAIGPFTAVALVFVTAAVGITLARGQGFAVLQKLQSGVEARVEVLEGPLLVLGALLLLIPGFVTDAVGFLLLIPPLRRAIARALIARVAQPMPGAPGQGPGVQRVVIIRGFGQGPTGFPPPGGPTAPRPGGAFDGGPRSPFDTGDVIDAEVIEERANRPQLEEPEDR
jgi:UPF0716 protein FxsA